MTFSRSSISLAVLAFALALAPATHAQTAQTPPTGQPPMGMGQPPMMSETARKEFETFRQEMDAIRKEREELDAARDALLQKCIPVEKDKAADCIKERTTLLDRSAKLHERIKTMQEKMQGMNRQHMGHGPMNGQPPAGAPSK